MGQSKINTSLGFPLEQQQNTWSIDLSDLKVFKGLSVLASVIDEYTIDQLEKSPGDVAFLYKISPNINPELIEFNIKYIQVFGRSSLLSSIVSCNKQFTEHLITVFGTLQRPVWWEKLNPPSTSSGKSSLESTALVFPASYLSGNIEKKYSLILERNINSGSDDGYFFRLSFEDHCQPTMDLSRIPHVIVDDLKNRVYISGSTRMAGSVRDNILRACSQGEREYAEENVVYSHLFEQLEKTKLGRLEKINFKWDNQFARLLFEESPEDMLLIFKKIFVSIEAGSICNILTSGEIIKVRLNCCYFTLYLSQLNRVFNININLPKTLFSAEKYLSKMPLLKQTALQITHTLDFSNTGIFLIHHITSEIIAFLEALHILKADSIHTLFVKYGGVIPSDYLDTLLDIPANKFYAAGLTRKATRKNRNFFTLSDYLSDTGALSNFDEILKNEKLDFFPAMKLLAGHMFLKFCMQQDSEKKKVLLIEDGGYLAPVLNDLAISNESTATVFQLFNIEESAPGGNFSDWLSNILLGTVEHTRNGFDRLKAVHKRHKTLRFPAFSIAISNNKLGEESQEVAHSILSAIESILHGNGLVLSQRKVLLLGSSGNIGRFLTQYLERGRLHKNSLPLLKVDLENTSPYSGTANSIQEIPLAELLKVDLFIGVTGISLLTKEVIMHLVLNSEKQNLFFASGSTKTEEFTELASWIDDLFEMDQPAIESHPVSIEYSRIIDPQSRIDQGGKVIIEFSKISKKRRKTLYLLNDFTPINFLYYGVPTETMDIVLNQLLSVSLGMKYAVSQNKELPAKIYAVDHDINEWGEIIKSPKDLGLEGKK